MGEQYEPRPTVVKEDFPAWNFYPSGAWNYALCIEPEFSEDLKVEWNESCTDPLDAANPALKVRVNAPQSARLANGPCAAGQAIWTLDRRD